MSTTHAVGTTATEAEVLAATQAAIAAGKDPFGDDDDDTTAAADDADDQGDDSDDAGAADDEGTENDADEVESDSTQDGADALSADALAAVAGEDAEEAPEPTEVRYKAADPADMAAQRATLAAEKAKALKDLMDGVIEPEEYSRIDGEVSEKLDALTVQRTLHEANAQREAQTTSHVLTAILEAAKAAGEVDYSTHPTAGKRFDAEMQLLAGDGVTRTYAQAATLAHKNVLAVLGITPKPAAEPKPEPAKPRANGKPPITLRDVPSAAVPNTGGGWQEQIGKLSGLEYDAAFRLLTPAQQAQLRGD